MNSIVRFLFRIGVISVIWPVVVSAEEKTESYTQWDQIVTDLKSSLNSTSSYALPDSNDSTYGMDDIKISVGAGMSFSYLSLSGDPAFKVSGMLQGIGVQFGIDLFHPEIQAEGSFRNYASDSLSSRVRAQVREFELRLVHSKMFPFHTQLRMGAGVSARYLDLTHQGSSGKYSRSTTVPSGVFLFGLSRTFGKSISVGPDVSYRSPFSSDRLENGSMDFHLRANAVF